MPIWIAVLASAKISAIGQYIAVYDLYSFGIGIGRYIGFADKGNVLSLSVSADTDFHIGN